MAAYTREDVEAFSYGGGIQSVCLCVLVKKGAIRCPDLTMIADTGRERRTTWDYLENVIRPYMKGTGMEVEVIPHEMSRVDLYAKTGELLIPAYDAHEGRLATYCSGEWKRDVVERFLRSMGVKTCNCWIGYSVDELWRVKKDHRYWCRYTHPLIDRMINRRMCQTIIEEAGLPMPKKSRCWGCPHQSDDEWEEVRNDPEDWKKAVELDEEIRASDERDGLFLYSGRVPLELANFTAKKGLVAPGRPCETGHCWT